MTVDHDVVVIGAGPAGTTAAILLARTGLSIALVEKQRFPRRKVCGECLAASNLPLLDALGVADAVMTNAGAELRRVTLMHRGGQVSAALPPAIHPRYAWGRAVGRESLDDILLNRARREGVDVFQPWRLRALDGRAGAWRCDLSEVGSNAALTLRAAVLVDAHGSWEPLPATALSDPPSSATSVRRPLHRPSDLLAFKANFTGADHPPGEISVLALDGGYGGMVVAGRDITTVACCVRRDRLEALRAAAPGLRAGEAVAAWLARDCAGVRRALDGATRTGSWLAAGPIRPGVRVGQADGVFRIGNAAGEAHPILGEGMSMALQSGALLAARIADARHESEIRSSRQPVRVMRSGDLARRVFAHVALHERHACEWRTNFMPRLRLAAIFAHATMHPNSTRMLVSAATCWPGLLTQGARWGGKTRSVTTPVETYTLPDRKEETPA